MFKPKYFALATASCGATVALGGLAVTGAGEPSTTTLAGAKATPVVISTVQAAGAKLQTGLQVTRYDPAQGKKNGYKLITRDGKKMIVKKGKDPVPWAHARNVRR
ncbi:hypothetical protein ACGFNU_08040 [Spirillospora sp. NPDC048911]|uniref:hypothetical protein n=1 Tax=Spirillospora sp. NPDC048911 TaxID=3364527 RepID=UPI003714C550